jgi:hypothetical protein
MPAFNEAERIKHALFETTKTLLLMMAAQIILKKLLKLLQKKIPE